MKTIRFHPGERKRYLLAIVAGLVLALAFPKLNVAGLAWLAPGLMLASALGFERGAAFRIGWMAGFAYHLTALYWLQLIPVAFVPILGWLALSAFLALFQGTWVGLCWKSFPARFTEGRPGVLNLLEQFISTRWSQRLVWAFACAVLWVGAEMFQARIFSGFPWNFLGASQYQMLPLIQIASVTGVYGVSFLLAWFSVGMLCAVASIIRRPSRRGTWIAELFLPILVVVAAITYGVQRAFDPNPPTAKLKVALIQPSIPQTMIWDPKDATARFEQLLLLSQKALAAKPDLLVWPEAAVPNLFRYDTNIHMAVTNFVRSHHIWMVIGADDVTCPPGATNDAQCSFFNSSFLLAPDGQIAGTYQKRRLVIFGEYVPLSRWLPFLSKLVQSEGEFTPGKKPVTFHLPSLRTKLSVLICFEDAFPHLAREYVEEDTDFLLNLTNNGWFGEGAAQWQHAANAVFRAIENGLPLVRCANNGLTCWVDPQGRMRDVFTDGSRGVYGVGYQIADIPLLAGHARTPTFYTRHGDVFGWSCVGFSLLALARAALSRRQPFTPATPTTPV